MYFMFISNVRNSYGVVLRISGGSVAVSLLLPS